MKTGIVGNVAGNVHALMSADRMFDDAGVERRVCAGNIVGMYPFVDESIEVLRTRNYQCIKMPIDTEFCGACLYSGWGDAALFDAIRFARSNCKSSDTLEYLKNLPAVLDLSTYGVFGLLGGRHFIYDGFDAQKAFSTMDWRIAFHAADPDPAIWYDNCSYHRMQTGEHSIDSSHKALISAGGTGSIICGSANVGFPSALIYDDSRNSVTVIKPMCELRRIQRELINLAYPRNALEILGKVEYRCWSSIS